jgi:hypothetical protein
LKPDDDAAVGFAVDFQQVAWFIQDAGATARLGARVP